MAEVAIWLTIWSFGPRAAKFVLQRASSSSTRSLSTSSTTTRSLSTTRTKMVKIFGVQRKIDIPEDKFPTEQELAEELESDKLLPNCQHDWYESVYEAAQLHYRYFLPSSGGKPKAVLIYQHGISTHGGKAAIIKDDKGQDRPLNMTLLAQRFCQDEQMAVYAPDMYGHGYSEGTRFLIPETWDNNLQDLVAFVKLVAAKHAGVPVFLLGESYGGTLTLHAAHYFQKHPLDNFNGILLTGPAIEGDMPPYPVYFVLRYLLAPVFPTWTPFFMPNPVSPERIWRDPQVLALRSNARWIGVIDGSGLPFRLGTALNLVLALEASKADAIPALTTPFCNVHGVKDAGVPISGSDFLWANCATPEVDRAYLRIEAGHHDLLSDPAAEETVEFFAKWIKERLEK